MGNPDVNDQLSLSSQSRCMQPQRAISAIPWSDRKRRQPCLCLVGAFGVLKSRAPDLLQSPLQLVASKTTIVKNMHQPRPFVAD